MSIILRVFLTAGFTIAVVLFFLYSSNMEILGKIERQLAGTLSLDPEISLLWKARGGQLGEKKTGQRGADVKIAQAVLKLYIPDQQITGIFGKKTIASIKEFQKKFGLAETGVIDKKTYQKMNELIKDTLCPKGESEHKFDYLLSRVNKKFYLPEGYHPPNLQIFDDIKSTAYVCLRREAGEKLREMFDSAKNDGIELAVTSSFRSDSLQKFLYTNNLKTVEGKYLVAPPQHSEHQLGTAVDLAGKSVKFRSVDTDFGESKEGRWLRENAHIFGFVMSYPREKILITGYLYEPWHWRYVGKDIANKIFIQNISLEEHFLDQEKVISGLR